MNHAMCSLVLVIVSIISSGCSAQGQPRLAVPTAGQPEERVLVCDEVGIDEGTPICVGESKLPSEPVKGRCPTGTHLQSVRCYYSQREPQQDSAPTEAPPEAYYPATGTVTFGAGVAVNPVYVDPYPVFRSPYYARWYYHPHIPRYYGGGGYYGGGYYRGGGGIVVRSGGTIWGFGPGGFYYNDDLDDDDDDHHHNNRYGKHNGGGGHDNWRNGDRGGHHGGDRGGRGRRETVDEFPLVPGRGERPTSDTVRKLSGDHIRFLNRGGDAVRDRPARTGGRDTRAWQGGDRQKSSFRAGGVSPPDQKRSGRQIRVNGNGGNRGDGSSSSGSHNQRSVSRNRGGGGRVSNYQSRQRGGGMQRNQGRGNGGSIRAPRFNHRR